MSVRPLREQVSDEEWRPRVDRAACYRLVALDGMSDLIFTHLTAELPAGVAGGGEQFLINPFGMLFDGVAASSPIRIDRYGNPLTDSPLPVDRADFEIHGAIHEARPEAACVLHTHIRAGVAVSARQDGLLPLSQQATDAEYGGGRLVHVDRQIVDGLTEAVSAVSDTHPARLAWPALCRQLDRVSPGYDHYRGDAP